MLARIYYYLRFLRRYKGTQSYSYRENKDLSTIARKRKGEEKKGREDLRDFLVAFKAQALTVGLLIIAQEIATVSSFCAFFSSDSALENYTLPLSSPAAD